MISHSLKRYSRTASFAVHSLVFHANFSLCEFVFFLSGQRGQKAGVEARKVRSWQRCNPAATDLLTFAKTLPTVQLKKSMPGIAMMRHAGSAFGANK
jgi:hypothetical protein